MKYKFIINQNAGKGKIKANPELLLSKIKRHFINFDFCFTNSLQDMDKCLNGTDDYDICVAVGGDGTINGIINKIIDKDKILGILPVGSGNDYIFSLGIPNNTEEALDILRLGNLRRIDAGKLETEKYSKYFANAVGIGFDAMVADRTNRVKLLPGAIKYYYALLESLFRYKPSGCEIIIDGCVMNKSCFLITVGNGKRTGGAFLLTPGALLSDGIIDICIVDNIPTHKVITALPKVLKGEHGVVQEVNFYRSKNVSVRSESELWVHYDGETTGMVKNIGIKVLPNILNVISV